MKVLVPVALLVAGALAVALNGPGSSSSSAALAEAAPATVAVQRGDLSAALSLNGTLGYGAPRDVLNRAPGTYTWLPSPGTRVGCGRTLYRVDDRPVLLLCGDVPLWRALSVGRSGDDVRALNRTLGVAGRAFTWRTAQRLQALQRRRGLPATGRLARGGAIVAPGPLRIASVDVVPGAPARSGERVVRGTSSALEVAVDLDPSQRDEVRTGSRAQVTLPDGRTTDARVVRVGRVAQVREDDGGAFVTASLRLDGAAGGFDRAPVRVEVVTERVRDVLSVPVVALVGRAGGGFAVERVSGGRRALVGVALGLVDSAGGRVQVRGGVRAGERVVVPSP